MFTCYLIINKKNGKCYVGMTSLTITKRFKSHSYAKKTYIDCAMRKHGRDNFAVMTLATFALEEDACASEIAWIAYLKELEVPLYNIAPGGLYAGPGLSGDKHPMFGKKASKEHIERMSQPRPSVQGDKNPFHNRKHSDETKRKMALKKLGKAGYWKGKTRPPMTDEARANISEACKGRVSYWKGKTRGPLSDEQKQKISEANREINQRKRNEKESRRESDTNPKQTS